MALVYTRLHIVLCVVWVSGSAIVAYMVWRSMGRAGSHVVRACMVSAHDISVAEVVCAKLFRLRWHRSVNVVHGIV